MTKRPNQLSRQKRQDLDTVKKSLQGYVTIIIDSDNETLIRLVEEVFAKIFKTVIEPKNLHRKKGKVIPIRGRKKNNSGE